MTTSIMLPETSKGTNHLQKSAGSLEEAGALLGATITRLSPATTYASKASSSSPSPSSHGIFRSPDNQQAVLFELFIRLHDLENWLRSSSSSPSTSRNAPSILAVLMKLFQICVSAGHSNSAPLLSNGVRHAWANSVAICCKLMPNQTRQAATDAKPIIPFMMDFLAAVNPKSQKAHGGTRLAAMCVLQYMYASSGPCNDDEYFEKYGRTWAMDTLQQTLVRGIKTHYGTRDDPHHRVAAMKCAANILIAQRNLRLSVLKKSQHEHTKHTDFTVLGALDDRGKTIPELVVRLIKQGSDDPYPEVRHQAAVLASVAASLLVSYHGPTPSVLNSTTHESPLAFLEDLMVICFKNLDDVQAAVSLQWSNALARCMCASMDCAQVFNIHTSSPNSSSSSSASHSKQLQDGSSLSDMFAAKGSDICNYPPTKLVSKWKPLRYLESLTTGVTANGSVVAFCKSLQACVELLVSMFRKAGGELEASPLGSSHSAGGRAVRIGYSCTLIYLLRLVQSSPQSNHWNLSLVPDVLHSIFLMVGEDLIHSGCVAMKPEHFSNQSPTTLPTDMAFNHNNSSSISNVAIFSTSLSGSHSSAADAPLARHATSRVLRRGLGGISTEPTQRALLEYLAEFCNLAPTIELLQQEELPSTAAISNVQSDVSTTLVPNEQQLQVALAEISHIIAALGEATFESNLSSLLLSAIRKCRVHADPGVRFESSILAASLVNSAPPIILAELLQDGIDELTTHLAHLIDLLKEISDPIADASLTVVSPARRTVVRSFRRNATNSTGNNSNTLRKDSINFLAHQYALHGNALLLSATLHQLSHLSQSVPVRFLDEILLIAESLTKCQFNETLAKHNAGAACTCVRAGYSLFAAAVTISPRVTMRFLQKLIDIWEQTGGSILKSTKHFFPAHDLICLEAMLSSLSSFLRFCSCLLISVPDVLNRINLLMEKMLSLISLPDGRLAVPANNPAAAIRLNSVKASIMEILTWLPPGSYPIAAPQLFSLASHHIRESVQNEACCSLLHELVPNEDRVIDLRSLNRSCCCSQVDEGEDLLIESLVALCADTANPNEVEAVMHSLTWKQNSLANVSKSFILGCPILGFSESEDARFPPPSVLHEVTNWRRPASPSASSRIRLVDAAIHAFACTFGLQSPREQEMAIKLLISLLPPTLVEPSNTNNFGVKDVLMSDSEKKVKSKFEQVIGSNVVATLILCIKSLPRQMGNEVEAISGATWSKLAGEAFRVLMVSCSTLVRRSASYGLALLATCGYNENALGLQTAVLTSLEEAIQWTSFADGRQSKKATFEAALFSSSSALMTVGCLQRAHKNVEANHLLPLPSSHMIRRLLASLLTFGGPYDTLAVRVSSLHSLSLVIAHYRGGVDEDWLSVLHNSCEVVGLNFVYIWTSNNKESALMLEPSLLTSLLRLMHSLLPHICSMASGIQWHAQFSSMAASILDISDKHPAVVREALSLCNSLFLASNTDTVHSDVINPRKYYYSSICLAILEPVTTKPMETVNRRDDLRSDSSKSLLGALILLSKIVTSSNPNEQNYICSSISVLRCRMITLLERISGGTYFQHSTKYRGISPPRIVERFDIPVVFVVEKVESLLRQLFVLDVCRNCYSALLHWLLFSRMLASGAPKECLDLVNHESRSLPLSSMMDKANSSAAEDVQQLLLHTSPPRWQVKKECCCAAQFVLVSLYETINGDISHSTLLDPVISRQHTLSESFKGHNVVNSLASLHLEDLISTACSMSTATSDQAELPSLQVEGLRWLSWLLILFCETSDLKSQNKARGLMLAQYSSQIVSCVRHSVNVPFSLNSMKLYLCGCEVALLILDLQLINEVSVLRRLFREVLRADTDIPTVSYSTLVEEGKILQESDVACSIDLSIFNLISGIGTYSQIQVYVDMGIYDGDYLLPILEECARRELDFAVHAAALSIDACQISRRRKSSWDRPLPQLAENTTACGISQQNPVKGLYYVNIDEISDVTIEAFSRFWPSMASFAVSRLAAYSFTDENATNSLCKGWLVNVLPILFIGARQALRTDSIFQDRKSIPSNLSAQRIVAICLFGIRKSLQCSFLFEDDTSIIEDLDLLLSDLTKLVHLPCIANASDLVPSMDLIIQTSDLIADLCETSWALSTLNRSLLLPLSCMQQKPVLHDAGFKILSSCLSCVYRILKGAETDSTKPISGVLCIKFLTDVCVRLLHLKGHGSIDCVKLIESTNRVISFCLRHSGVSDEYKRLLCQEMSIHGYWDAWCLVCSHLEDLSGLVCSLPAVKRALNNYHYPEKQKEVLNAIAVLLQNLQGNYSALSAVMNRCGLDILLLFKQYGLCLGDRSAVNDIGYALCRESTNLLLFAFNQLVLLQMRNGCELVSEHSPAEESASRFLILYFDVLVAIIQRDELTSGEKKLGDEAHTDIFKLCARTIVELAKASSSVFKISLTAVAEEARYTIESAMRSELRMYQVASLEHTKGHRTEKRSKINFKAYTGKIGVQGL